VGFLKTNGLWEEKSTGHMGEEMKISRDNNQNESLESIFHFYDCGGSYLDWPTKGGSRKWGWLWSELSSTLLDQYGILIFLIFVWKIPFYPVKKLPRTYGSFARHFRRHNRCIRRISCCRWCKYRRRICVLLAGILPALKYHCIQNILTLEIYSWLQSSFKSNE
jgi:hypothetical protein